MNKHLECSDLKEDFMHKGIGEKAFRLCKNLVRSINYPVQLSYTGCIYIDILSFIQTDDTVLTIVPRVKNFY